MSKISTKFAGQSVPDKIAYHTVRTIVTVFCRVWCRMSIEGRENFPKVFVQDRIQCFLDISSSSATIIVVLPVLIESAIVQA